jgi:hypothetical protein
VCDYLHIEGPLDAVCTSHHPRARDYLNFYCHAEGRCLRYA